MYFNFIKLICFQTHTRTLPVILGNVLCFTIGVLHHFYLFVNLFLIFFANHTHFCVMNNIMKVCPKLLKQDGSFWLWLRREQSFTVSGEKEEEGHQRRQDGRAGCTGRKERKQEVDEKVCTIELGILTSTPSETHRPAQLFLSADTLK